MAVTSSIRNLQLRAKLFKVTKILKFVLREKEMNGPVAVGRNEVEATMDAVVNDGLAV
jgi:hypothetical protein